eukprot:GDKI01009146.1.p2 GENE.GDKI01009146.1~~GDKI01009146.1.p2  ORF type:complete len:135 (-),score=6.18 GDKI01009146.1:16-420(-)
MRLAALSACRPSACAAVHNKRVHTSAIFLSIPCLSVRSLHTLCATNSLPSCYNAALSCSAYVCSVSVVVCLSVAFFAVCACVWCISAHVLPVYAWVAFHSGSVCVCAPFCIATLMHQTVRHPSKAQQLYNASCC